MIQVGFSIIGLSGKTKSSTVWCDLGESNHMTCSLDYHEKVKPYNGPLKVHMANDEEPPITGIGYIPPALPLQNMLLIPELSINLLSVGQLISNNCTHFPSQLLTLTANN